MLLGSRLASGICALYELAVLPERRSSVRALAKKCGVAESFLRRVLLDLRAKGYLEAQKGRVGGFTLLKDPEKIKILDLAKILEKEPILVLGQLRRDLWTPDPNCPTYSFWDNFEKKFLAELEKMSLADIIAMAAESPRTKRSSGRTKKAARRRAQRSRR